MAVDARDDAAFRILDICLEASSQFIAAAHSRGVGVLVHCMAGVNRYFGSVDVRLEFVQF
jgi:protein tyrosine phosphatase